jgi:hypothetical protein
MRARRILFALSMGLAAPAALAQVPVSAAGRECVRINDAPNGLGDWDARERNRKLWIEASTEGLLREPTMRV